MELGIAHQATAQVGARELLTKLRPPWWRASRSRGDRSAMVGDYIFEIVAGRRAGSATVYLDPTGEFPWQDRADLPITTSAKITAMLENCQWKVLS